MSRVERVLWAIVLAVSVVTHLAALEDRAASHDESMHAFYSYELATKGEYRHDPMMHGPFLFHATALVFVLLGASDTTARLLPALCGIGLVPLLWLFRRYLGRAGALSAAGLVTISPSILFYGRCLWSDLFLLVAGLLWVYGGLRYLETRAPRFLFLVAGAMSVSFCAKETAFISGLTFGAFFAGLAAVRVIRGRERLRESPAGHVAVVMLTLVLPFLAALVHVVLKWNPAEFDGWAAHARALSLVGGALVVSALLAWLWTVDSGPNGLRFRTWLGVAGAFWVAPLLLFTSFFTNFARGVTSGIVGSLGYWLGQHEVARGSQPWFYYVMLTVVYEPLALVAALAGCAWLARRGRGAGVVVPLLAWWVVSSFVAYSWAGEKMPWLLVHMALPLALLGGFALAQLWSAVAGLGLPRIRLIAVVALPAVAVGVLAPLALLRPSGRTLEAAEAAARLSTQALVLLGLLYAAWRLSRPLRLRELAAPLALGLAVFLGAYQFRSALQLSFVNGDLATELLVYAHGTPDIKRTLREIADVAARTGQGDALEVAYDDDSTWPLTWYLRAYPKQRYLGDAPAPPALLAPVVVIGSKNIGAAQPHLERDYVRRDYRLIWWPAEDYMRTGPRDWWRALADPARRQRLARYLVARDTGYDLTEWPLRHEFKLFVRKDLVAQAWPLGYEQVMSAAAAGPSAPALPELTCTVASRVTGPFEGRRLEGPAAVAVAPDGRRLIADTNNHRVVVLDRDDAFVQAFGTRCDLAQGAAGGCVDADGDGPLALGDGQLNEPWGIAPGPDGAILVADTWNGRVAWFDAKGRFVRAFGHLSMGTAPPVPTDVMYGPRGLAYDAARGVVAVADTGHKRILLLGRDGTLRAEHGGPGTAAGRFDEPVGVAFAPDGALVVADAWNRRLQRFDTSLAGTGEWPVSGWGSRAIGDKPYVAVSSTGVVYASDPAGARVFVYSPEGSAVAALSVAEWRLSPRSRPTGLALDEKRGQLVVADPATSTVWSIAIGQADRPCHQD
jgi:uncharacterized protein (TIGR03663 family)